MTTKEITYNKLKEAVKVALSGDNQLAEFYDPKVNVTCMEDMVSDVLEKIRKYNEAMKVTMMAVYEKNELVGYFVYSNMLLISFALNVQYRVRSYKNEFFKLIKKTIHPHFATMLYSKNTRAIKWMLKQEMSIMNQNNDITTLIKN